MVLTPKTMEIKQLNPKLWDPYLYKYLIR